MARLQGWKEIGAHVGKSVRTLQRWEREYGFPVHRVGREGGEIVWADSEEVDSWFRAHISAEQQDPAETATAAVKPEDAPLGGFSDHRERGAGIAVMVALIAVVVGALWWVSPFRRRSIDGPVNWRIAGGTFQALDAQGALLWARHFDTTVLAAGAFTPEVDGRQGGRVLLHDLDGDARNEVLLLIADRSNPGVSGLRILNSDGSDRVPAVLPGGEVRFGDKSWAGPWFPYREWVLQDDATTRALIYVAFIHLNEFPTVLVQFDAAGRERGRYWSNGYVESVAHGSYRGQRAVYVGATNNDTKGASLAILPRDHLHGAPPAVDARYRCTSCGSEMPSEFLIFPRRCISIACAGTALVEDIQVDEVGGVRALVTEGPEGVDARHTAAVWYTLSPEMRVTEAFLTSGLLLEHRAERSSGILDHSLGAADERSLFPVLRWTAEGFERLLSAPVARQGGN
jgi:hypothetical protein